MIIEAAELESMWELILGHVGKLTGRENIQSLFLNTKLLSVSKDKAVVSVQNQFLGDMISKQYYTSFLDSIHHVLSIPLRQIQLIVDETINEAYLSEGDDLQSHTPRKTPFGLNTLQTFSSFVAGLGSRFAYAASVKVSESPGNAYNPLFIYGDVGLGKTHLLSAIGNAVWNSNPQYRIAYVTSEYFTNDFISSIRHKKMDEFQNRYRNIDILLIDDIQFISGKESTQEEFFHTFNALYKEHKQVVFSADRPAKELSGIEERLRSRFEMGLVADIQPPDLETKIAIIYKKAEKERISLPSEVVNFIAQSTRSNVRELEGALIRLGAYSSLVCVDITLDLAKYVLKDITVPPKQEIRIEDVHRAVTEKFHLKAGDLKSKRRTKQIAIPRQVAMYLCRELTKASFPEIGTAFGGRDHSTAIHACKHITQEIQQNEQIREEVRVLTALLKGGT